MVARANDQHSLGLFPALMQLDECRTVFGDGKACLAFVHEPVASGLDVFLRPAESHGPYAQFTRTVHRVNVVGPPTSSRALAPSPTRPPREPLVDAVVEINSALATRVSGNVPTELANSAAGIQAADLMRVPLYLVDHGRTSTRIGSVS